MAATLKKIRNDIDRVNFIDPTKGIALRARFANIVNSQLGRGIIGRGEADELLKVATESKEEAERKGIPELKQVDDIPALALHRSDGTWYGFVKQYRLLNPTMKYADARQFCSKYWKEKKKIIQRTKVLTDKKTWDLIEPSSGVPISNANFAEGKEHNKYEKDVNDIGGAGVEGKGSGEITPKIKSWLEKYGDWNIDHITIGRNPIISVISQALKLVSVKPFDQLFHLYLILTLQAPDSNSEKNFILEKNHLVQAYPASSSDENPKAKREVSVPAGLKLRDFLSKGEHALPAKVFWTYDGFNGKDGTNCQKFAWTLLKANKLGSSADEKFIMQDVKDLVPGWVKRFSKKVTDTAATIGEKINGGYSLKGDVATSGPKEFTKKSNTSGQAIRAALKFKTQPVIKESVTS